LAQIACAVFTLQAGAVARAQPAPAPAPAAVPTPPAAAPAPPSPGGGKEIPPPATPQVSSSDVNQPAPPVPLPASAPVEAVRYSVRIDAPDPLDDLLEDNLDLVRWQGNPRLDLEQLQRLVRISSEQARTLVETEGYYQARVSTGLDTSQANPVARVIVDPGPPVLVGAVDIQLSGATPPDGPTQAPSLDDLRRRWGLPAGARFRTADWEASKRNLLRMVAQTRYPRARLAESAATVDPAGARADLKVVVDAGPVARFGPLRIEGLSRYSEQVITNLNQIRPGDEYSEAALQAFQARLQDTGYFSGVEVAADLGPALDAEIEAADAGVPPPPRPNPEVLPVLVRVTENKSKLANVGLGYSTDTGMRAQVEYGDLSVWGMRMRSNLVLESKRQSARLDFARPTSARGFNDSFGAVFERTDVQGEVTRVASLSARRAWGTPLLERSLTVELLSEDRAVAGSITHRSKSLPLTYAVTRRKLDSLLLPTDGYVWHAQFGGALLPVLTDERFLRALTRAVRYIPASRAGTLILRGEAGALASREKAGVPGVFLFRAGGDQSVRGYGYQTLGVREGEAVVGGRYLLTGSAEYQYFFKPPWGAAVFVDAGNAADSLRALKPKLGYGIGARWRSPVGPINVDLAYGKEERKARLHFSLGFTF
jgi:translocation and assembly module TamA